MAERYVTAASLRGYLALRRHTGILLPPPLAGEGWGGSRSASLRAGLAPCLTLPRKSRANAYGTTPLLPLPACGERIGVRGRFHKLRLAERPPHPRSLRSLDLSPHAGRGEGGASYAIALPASGGGNMRRALRMRWNASPIRGSKPRPPPVFPGRFCSARLDTLRSCPDFSEALRCPSHAPTLFLPVCPSPSRAGLPRVAGRRARISLRSLPRRAPGNRHC